MATPLVSVIVTSYNSAPYIVETLESVKAQTYANIELIVSDDCSADDTVAISRAWIEKNKDRFVRTDIVTVPRNTGVSANCNRCIKAANSDWIKFIAGDDILLPNCIEDNIRFATEHGGVKVLFSQVSVYANDFKQENHLRTIPEQFPARLMHPSVGPADQFKLLLISDRISFTPSYFFNRQAVLAVGGYDERQRLVEDYPMWLKLTKAGYKLHFMMKLTVGYRQHQKALNNMANEGLFKPLFLKMKAFREEYVYPHLPWDIVWAEKHIVFVSRLFQATGLNRNRPLQKKLYKFFTVYMNPFQYIYSFKKHVLGKGKKDLLYSN